MAIIRPNIYQSSVVADPLAAKEREKWGAMASNAQRHINAVGQAYLRQVAIDDALAKMDARREAAAKKRNEEAAAKALGWMDESDVQALSDEVRDLEGSRHDYTVTDSLDNLTAGSVRSDRNQMGYGATPTLGGVRDRPRATLFGEQTGEQLASFAHGSPGVRHFQEPARDSVNMLAAGPAPTRTYDGLGNEGVIETLKNALLRVQAEEVAAEMFGGIAPPSAFAGADFNQAQLSQALAGLAAAPVEAGAENPLSGVRGRPRDEFVDIMPQLANQKRMNLVAAAVDRARAAPPKLDPDLMVGIEQALKALRPGELEAGSTMDQARGLGGKQRRDIPEDMLRDRLQRILAQDYFGTETDRVGPLLDILRRARTGDITDEERVILENFLIFSGQRDPARGGSQAIGPLRRSEMTPSSPSGSE